MRWPKMPFQNLNCRILSFLRPGSWNYATEWGNYLFELSWSPLSKRMVVSVRNKNSTVVCWIVRLQKDMSSPSPNPWFLWMWPYKVFVDLSKGSWDKLIQDLGQALNPMTVVLEIERKEIWHLEVHRRKAVKKTEIVIGGMCLYNNECQELPGATRSWEIGMGNILP